MCAPDDIAHDPPYPFRLVDLATRGHDGATVDCCPQCRGGGLDAAAIDRMPPPAHRDGLTIRLRVRSGGRRAAARAGEELLRGLLR